MPCDVLAENGFEVKVTFRRAAAVTVDAIIRHHLTQRWHRRFGILAIGPICVGLVSPRLSRRQCWVRRTNQTYADAKTNDAEAREYAKVCQTICHAGLQAYLQVVPVTQSQGTQNGRLAAITATKHARRE